jgi:hypothetical protein
LFSAPRFARFGFSGGEFMHGATGSTVHELAPRLGDHHGSLPALVEAELGVPLVEVNRQVAATARKRIKDAVEQTTGKVLPKGKVNQFTVVPQIAEPQRDRASKFGIGTRTQEKLDRLARDFPLLHERVKSGELSVHAAAVQAGIVKPTLTVPRDVPGLVAALCRFFTDDELDEVVDKLSSRDRP